MCRLAGIARRRVRCTARRCAQDAQCRESETDSVWHAGYQCQCFAGIIGVVDVVIAIIHYHNPSVVHGIRRRVISVGRAVESRETLVLVGRAQDGRPTKAGARLFLDGQSDAAE